MFVKGDPRINRDGRRKGTLNFTTKVRRALEAIGEGNATTVEEQLIEAILHNAIVERDPMSQKLIWNYLDGMPQLHVDHTSDGEPITDTAIVYQLTKQLNDLYRERHPKIVEAIHGDKILGSGDISSDGGVTSAVDVEAPNKE